VMILVFVKGRDLGIDEMIILEQMLSEQNVKV
jgi:hypothetical protein